jgi:hypothetical protein
MPLSIDMGVARLFDPVTTKVISNNTQLSG